MPRKGSGEATDWRELDRWDLGVGWIAYPDEDMQRASHAFAVDGDVWVVDPVDAPGLDDLLAEFGEVAGVVVLLDRHTRDAADVANRHGVSVHVHETMADLADELDAPVEPVHLDLGDTGYGMYDLIDNRFWREAFLYGEETGQLIVPEALGTAPMFRTAGERLGVHPALRLKPPRRIGRLSPDRLDVGHGEGIARDPLEAIVDALGGARRRAPRLYADTLKELVLG